MLAVTQTVDLARILTDLAVILIAAKLAAEVAERIGVPAVLGEILAGLLIGPSVLGWAHHSTPLYVIAEIGVILLLTQVGMEMDLGELRRVGRASFLVAVIGVAAPMLVGVSAGLALGESTNTSLFIGAALTATSVGITARVFGDLRALATTEARVVLGAAVADDVLGLIILTVVTRIVEQGSVDLGTVLSTIGGAVAFLLVAGLLAISVIPRILNFLSRFSSAPSSISVLAIGVAFAFSASAMSTDLAPIIGAFVAGIALAKVNGHERLNKDVTSLSAFFVPIFFVSIGIDTDIGAMAHPKVIGLALLLTLIAIIGKLVSAVGALGTSTDKVLIGIGMIPRGEVGLIFATIGLSVGVFDEDMHATILLVVLLTTVITPPLLRWRLGRAPSNDALILEDTDQVAEPEGGWLKITNGEIELAALPPAGQTLTICLKASVLANNARPGNNLLDWVAAHRNTPLAFDYRATEEFLHVLREGGPRSWRFLEVSAVLERALPEVANAMQRRYADASELDPTHSLAFPSVESLRDLTSVASSQNDVLLIAAFLLDIASAGADAYAVLSKLDIDLAKANEIKDLLEGSRLLKSAVAREPIRSDIKTLSEIAQHLRHPSIVERARLLATASGVQLWQESALIDLTTGIQQILAHPELLESDGSSVASTRLREAIEAAADPEVAERLRYAPASYLLSHDIDTLIRQARLVEPAPAPGNVRVHIESGELPNTWIIDVACRNRNGLLARITSVLANEGLSVLSADVATWPDGAVIDSFLVESEIRPSREHLAHHFGISLRKRFQRPRRISGVVELSFDNEAHPWHTVVDVHAPDQVGLLNAIAFAFAKAHIQIHHALIQTKDGVAIDRFEVSDRTGRKLSNSVTKRARRWLSISGGTNSS